MDLQVVTFKGAGKQPWRFRLVGGNNETVTTSEGYLTRWNRDRAVKKLNLPIRTEKEISTGSVNDVVPVVLEPGVSHLTPSQERKLEELTKKPAPVFLPESEPVKPQARKKKTNK